MRSLLALALLSSLACSTGSSPAGTQEAGLDAPAEAADDACFPLCGSGSSSGGSGSGGGGDAGGEASCADLKNQIATLQAPAQACNPQLQSQCTGVVQGLCCAITVSAGNDPAANAFQQAVDAYKGQCDAGCMTPVCPTAPSNDCQLLAPSQPSQGACK